MTELTVFHFIMCLLGLATLILSVVFFMLKYFEKNTSTMFNAMKEQVTAQIEQGTKEHDDFRKGLNNHDALFREISANMGELKGQVAVVISLLQQGLARNP